MASGSGKCLCGKVHFTVEDVQPHFHACHCGTCRRWTSGPLLSASVEGVKFTGEENITVFDSSDWAERGFCRHCGTALFYHLKEAGDYFMNMSAFDDPAAFSMASEIFIDHKPVGYEFAGDHPRQTEAEFVAMISGS